MAFDGNGNWISDFSAVADRDAGIKILASRFDNIFINDIATSFENCLTKDGQVKTQTNLNANNYRVINVADPVNDKDAVNKETLEVGNITTTGDWTFSGDVALNGDTTAVTPASATDNTTAVATTAWVNNFISSSDIKKVLTNLIAPNWSAGFDIANGYVATQTGWVLYDGSANYRGGGLWINNFQVCMTDGSPGSWTDSCQTQILVGAGDVITYSVARICKFIPCKGG